MRMGLHILLELLADYLLLKDLTQIKSSLAYHGIDIYINNIE